MLGEVNLDWNKIITPVKVNELGKLLSQSRYNENKAKFLLEGFTQGFDIGYREPKKCQHVSNNLPFHIGSLVNLWNKVMKEVKAKRYAGPYTQQQLPFDHYVQSPLGLVPKAGGKMHLIIHLSYDFGKMESDKSINHHTPESMCKVSYRDLDFAIRASLELLRSESDSGTVYYSKSDFSNAFRILPILVNQCR